MLLINVTIINKPTGVIYSRCFGFGKKYSPFGITHREVLMSITASKYGGLAQQLISEGIVSEAHMKTAQTESQQQQIGLVPYLVDNKLANAYQVAQMLSQASGDPLFDLDALSSDVIPKALVDEKTVRKF